MPEQPDFNRLIQCVSTFARVAGIETPTEAHLYRLFHDVLIERGLFEAAQRSIVTRDEALHALLAHLETLLDTEFKLNEEAEICIRLAIFGQT